MRFVSFNVNGLRAILKKDFNKIFDDLNPDIMSLNETKLSDDKFPLEKEGYYIYFTNSKVKKGYSGVSVFSKIKPLNVHYGLEDHLYDDEGRVITLEFETFYYVCCYVPNSGEGLKRLDFRIEFENNLRRYLADLKQKKHVIYAGDLNVAHQEIDLKNPSTNHNNAGFTDQERNEFTKLLEQGFIDTYRYLNPNKVEYWFHTHGLYRVGSIELEIVGVEDSNASYGALLNTCAKMFIERGVPEAGFKFNPAYNVYVCWFPWQEALKKLNIADDVSGSAKDRNDGVHNTPSGILLAVDNDGNYHSLDYYKKELTDNPMFMMSYFETSLMREAAFEKLEYFLELLNKNKGDEKTSFLVKLGYGETEENPNDLEHLWFDVHDFTDDGYFDATLINEPYKDLGMHEGDRGMHSIERLTDWTIYSEEGEYNSRNIYLLFE